MKSKRKKECGKCGEIIEIGEKIKKGKKNTIIHYNNDDKTKNDPITIDPKLIYLWIIKEIKDNNDAVTFFAIHKISKIIFDCIKKEKLNRYFTKDIMNSNDDSAHLGKYYNDLQRSIETDFATGILKFCKINKNPLKKSTRGDILKRYFKKCDKRDESNKDEFETDFYLHDVELSHTGEQVLKAKKDRLKRRIDDSEFSKIEKKIKETCKMQISEILKDITKPKKKEDPLEKKIEPSTCKQEFTFVALLPSASPITDFDLGILQGEYAKSYEITVNNMPFKNDLENVLERKQENSLIYSNEFKLHLTDKYQQDWNKAFACFGEEYEKHEENIHNDLDQDFHVMLYEEGMIEITGSVYESNKAIIKRQLIEFCYAMIFSLEDDMILPNIADVDARTGSGLLYYGMAMQYQILNDKFINEIKKYIKTINEDVFDIFNITLLDVQEIIDHRILKHIPVILYHAFNMGTFKGLKNTLDILHVRSYRTSVNFHLFSQTMKRIQNNFQFPLHGNQSITDLIITADSYSRHFQRVHEGLSTPTRLYGSLIAINGIVFGLWGISFALLINQHEGIFSLEYFLNHHDPMINYLNIEKMWSYIKEHILMDFLVATIFIVSIAGLWRTPLSRLKTSIDGISRTFNITPNNNKSKRKFVILKRVKRIFHSKSNLWK